MRSLPRGEREWLVRNGEVRLIDAGERLATVGDDVTDLFVLLSGRIVVYFGLGGGRRHAIETPTGSMTGALPYSRLSRAPYDVTAEERVEALTIHRRCFPEMVRECPVLTESLVHTMLDRARRFAAANWEDEKVTSLGRLAAGLAHELNNPAAAAARSARRLAPALADVGAAAHAVGAANLGTGQLERLRDLVARCQQPLRSVALGALQREDRIEDYREWLERHEIDPDEAETLVDGGVGVAELESLVHEIPAATRRAVVRWVASAASAAIIAADIERATRRIDDLVSAVRRHTHMDRPPEREVIDVAAGLTSTAEVLRAEANVRNASLTLEIEQNLPRVLGVAPDLNQVWSQLIQNALDAVSSGGEVAVRAAAANASVLVRVTDNGSGIPEDVQPRIFDPFFTTKPQGTAVGLGLDIVRRVVHSHGGEVEFESRPGHTEFVVRLPVAS